MWEEERAFGQSLRALREHRGLTQEGLSLEAELSRNFISQLELGTKSPSLRTIFRLCKVLEIAPAELMKDVVKRMA